MVQNLERSSTHAKLGRAAIGIGSVMLLALAYVLVTVEPAAAAKANCPSGTACVWRDLNCESASSGSNYREFSQYISDYRSYNYRNTSSNVNDTITGVMNNGNFESVRWYIDFYQLGAYFTLPINTGDCDLGNGTGGAPSGFNNRITSGAFSSFYS